MNLAYSFLHQTVTLNIQAVQITVQEAICGAELLVSH